ARNGRAEVLKAQGQLESALAAYDEVIQRHPDNVVARTGRLWVLVQMGRLDHALESFCALPNGSLDYWIQEHIRGMILLRQGKLDTAERVFAHGVSQCAYAVSKPYFLTGLALCHMRTRRFASALEFLPKSEGAQQSWGTRLLRVHALAETADFTGAAEDFSALPDLSATPAAPAVHEIEQRYILRAGPQQTDDWLFEQEVAICLLQAA
ncbi:MAG: tetratricopeptide repeat protein, partial [Planctomycetaceae bacterium]|nr:tetratricopeptide repeat protein [Planctomycetaceae bacterium]